MTKFEKRLAQAKELDACKLDTDSLFRCIDTAREEMQSTQTGETARALRTMLKRRTLAAMKQERADEFLQTLPAPGETLHILSNGDFDYWNLIHRAIELLNAPLEHLFLSTWTVNLPICNHIVRLYDAGIVKSITFWLNNYLMSRDPAVWAFATESLHARGQKIFSTENHAKLSAFRTADGRHIVIEGSANLTANPRIEQNCISNSAELYHFYVNAYKYLEPRKTRA